MRLSIYIFGLGILLISEYGFLWRKKALALWQAKWRWQRALIRASALAALWLASARQNRASGFILLGTMFALGELSALIQRHLIRSGIRRGLKHGGVWAHLYPFVYAAVFTLLMGALMRHLGPASLLATLREGLIPLAIALAVIMMWTWGTFFTVSVIDLARPEQVMEVIKPSIGAGELIGILERYLAFILVASGGFTAMGFVFAAKAAARFPQFERQEFAEYFLIGSMSSVGMAIAAGMAIRILASA